VFLLGFPVPHNPDASLTTCCLKKGGSNRQCCGSESESERIRALFAESESEIFVPNSDSDLDPDPDPVK
jgi:hypothetical protein